ncbi:MAG: IMP cyclohydrolase [Nanoarchaeota archaeon]|nr:IMP cyclohydrolase [Nanoarchaeota archaeon]
MGTDVSSFKEAYRTPISSNFPDSVTIRIGTEVFNYGAVNYPLRYGTNPHQPFMAYKPLWNPFLSIGGLEMLKGGKSGLSLTNIQDMSQAWQTLKYFDRPAVTLMKHLNPCGFDLDHDLELLEIQGSRGLAEAYRSARGCDERSAFGAVAGFNRKVDARTAEALMETFIECVIAPDYEPEALEILRKNEGTKKLNNSLRVAKAGNLDRIPKFIGDNTKGFYNLRVLADGTLTIEEPYLTRIKSVADFVTDPMIVREVGGAPQNYTALTQPTSKQLQDGLTAWRLVIQTRSNGIIFVKNDRAIAVGTGEQERVGAVEQAIDKARKKGHSLEGAVMASDAFFPKRDCIDEVAKHKVGGVVWPAGSLGDWETIQAANEHGIALMATLERCFAHH